jgi:hypothetical protein
MHYATAIPISAFFKAGASLTPFPVIPQICFFSVSQSHICVLETPQRSHAFSINSSTGRAIDLSLPSNEDEGYVFVPFPSLEFEN